MNKFEPFSIKSIPHIEKYDIDMLENKTSNNDPIDDMFSIELICRLSISDNKWRIFDDNQHIIHFLHS